tara:strand:+ start:1274 stop:2794 length:1521 start_codon:yes stop_codon:yes gene_type:complete
MADNDSVISLFGFELKRAKKKETALLPSIVPPTDEDGAGYVTAAGAHYGQILDMDQENSSKDNNIMIMRYRGVATHPEVDMAIEEIVGEAISTSELKSSVALNMDNVEGVSDKVKKAIQEEFDKVVNMLNFNDLGTEMFKRWYVDGRMYHHLVIDENKTQEGIQEIRNIDASKIRKVKKVNYTKDPRTGAKLVAGVDEFYIYEEKPGMQSQGIKLSTDAINYVTSGLLDEGRRKVVSHLHKAMKPINQLRMMEDSLVIYRLARAPERRIFYIDVGNLPRGKANEYMAEIQTKYRNKLVYDANTGAIRDDRKHMSMLEDFWLPRREGGRGTEISTLPGGENLGQIDDIIYFQKRMYRSLNVPVSRLEQENTFSLGRSTEISRDEVKFHKFIEKLRRRFSKLFLDCLKTQLVLKGIITDEDWQLWRNDIVVDYIRDNNFTEMRDMELLRERLQTMDMAQQYVGEFLSKEYVMKNVLMLDDEEVEKMKKQIDVEIKAGEIEQNEDDPKE